MKNYEIISQAISYLVENHKDQPDLIELASSVRLSPYHFQRVFAQWAGVSPKKFLQYLSIRHAKKILNEEKTLFDASYETGFSSTSRLHDLFVNIEGMTPGEYKNQGENLTIHYSQQDSIFGKYLLASTSKGICNLYFYEDVQKSITELKESWRNAKLIEGTDTEQEKVIQFLNHENPIEKIRLHLKGTDFQIKIWEALLKIPEAKLVSYSQIAKEIKQENAARAIGSAVGANPIGYIIPCHRVIKNTGIIGEYRWGSIRKTAMIGYESSHCYGD